MKLLADLTKRRYAIAVGEGDIQHINTCSLDYIFSGTRENDYEYIYALHEIADELLDMKLGESIYFKPNRDNDIAKGLITRIR